LLSSCRLLRFSPVYVAGRRHARIKLAPRRESPAFIRSAEPIGHDFPDTFRTRIRHRRSDSRSVRRAKLCRAAARTLRRCNRTPLLRFSVPFSACRPRCAVRGGQASGRSRFDVTHRLATRAFHGTPWDLRRPVAPLRFFALRMRCGACSMCGLCVGCVLQIGDTAWTRWLNDPAARTTLVFGRSCGRWSGEPLVRVHRATRHIKRHRFTNPLPEPGHAPTRSLARCSATETAQAFAAWPGDWSFPLARPAALMGFNDPSQVCSRRWVTGHF